MRIRITPNTDTFHAAHFALQENHDINQLNYEKNMIPKTSTREPEKKKKKKKHGRHVNRSQHTVNMFIEAGNNNIENLLTEKIHFQNQTSVFSKKRFERNLQLKRDIDSYIQKATRQLGDANFYIKLIKNPILGYNNKVNTVIDNFKKQNLITNKQKKENSKFIEI